MNTANTKKWYQKTGFIILFLVVFFPVGLFLMWKYTNWNKNVKIAVSAILALLVGIGLITSDTDKDSTETDAPVNGIVENSTIEDECVSVTEEFTTKTETTTEEKTTTVEETTAAETTTKKQPTTERETTTEKETTTRASRTVYRTKNGECYHYKADCPGKNGYAVSLDDAIAAGKRPCEKCVH